MDILRAFPCPIVAAEKIRSALRKTRRVTTNDLPSACGQQVRDDRLKKALLGLRVSIVFICWCVKETMPPATRSPEINALLDAFQCMWFDPHNWPSVELQAEYVLATFDMEVRVSAIEALRHNWPEFIESKFHQLEGWLDVLNCSEEATDALYDLEFALESHSPCMFVCIMEDTVFPLFGTLNDTLDEMSRTWECIDELRIPGEDLWKEQVKRGLSTHERVGILLEEMRGIDLDRKNPDPDYCTRNAEWLKSEYRETFEALEFLASNAEFDNNEGLRRWIVFAWAATFQHYQSNCPFL